MTALVVESVGHLALVEDLGRPGYAALGVTGSGAADRGSLRLANRLVGNPESAAGLEVLLGALSVRSSGRTVVAVTGAPVPLSLNGSPADAFARLALDDGDRLELGTASTGLRSYLCVAGGILADRVFGSASTDPTTGVGPAVVSVGRRLEVANPSHHSGDIRGLEDPVLEPGPTEVAAVRAPAVGGATVRVVLGPRSDWFTPAAVARLTSTTWVVSADLDRVGVRLDGPPLERQRDGELPSEGLVRGSVQVPVSGQPLVFLADHPTTGGYPVIAVVVDADTDALGQLRPGDHLRFRAVAPGW